MHAQCVFCVEFSVTLLITIDGIVLTKKREDQSGHCGYHVSSTIIHKCNTANEEWEKPRHWRQHLPGQNAAEETSEPMLTDTHS